MIRGICVTHQLPDIDIRTDEPMALLDAMARLGRASGRFDVDRRTIGGEASRIDGVNFRLRGEAVHEDLGFQLLARASNPQRVEIEARAHRWRPDPPTRAVYLEAVQSMVTPLLSAFNRAQGARLRLRVEAQGAGGFRPSDRTVELLERFIVCANTSSLHPLDWGRFHDLVREGRQQIPTGDLRARLIKGGFSNAKADHLADVYDHLWTYKQRR
jgi:hypothetical protein